MSRYEPDRTVGLPPGTRVWNRRRGRRARFGTVMPHAPEYTRGCFPVRWDDEFWQTCNAAELTVVVAQTGDSGVEIGRSA